MAFGSIYLREKIYSLLLWDDGAQLIVAIPQKTVSSVIVYQRTLTLECPIYSYHLCYVNVEFINFFNNL